MGVVCKRPSLSLNTKTSEGDCLHTSQQYMVELGKQLFRTQVSFNQYCLKFLQTCLSAVKKFGREALSSTSVKQPT
jgi:hypothetical protein